MTTFFCDSSALVKRYLNEIGSAWFSALVAPSSKNAIVVAGITRVEVAAALAARHRTGAITLADRDSLVALLLSHCDTEYRIAGLDTEAMSRAVELTQRHRLRGYDAVQLATALIVNEEFVAAGLPSLTFVTADSDLVAAAQAEGVTAENPNLHP